MSCSYCLVLIQTRVYEIHQKIINKMFTKTNYYELFIAYFIRNKYVGYHNSLDGTKMSLTDLIKLSSASKCL